MLKAIRFHDPAKGKLSTVAYRGIRWEILLHIQKEDRQRRILKGSPLGYLIEEDIKENFPDLTKDEDDVLDMLIKGFTDNDIKKLTGLQIKRLQAIKMSLKEKVRM